MMESSLKRSWAQLLSFTVQLYVIAMLIPQGKTNVQDAGEKLCHKDAEPPIDVMFFLYTGQSVSTQDFQHLKEFAEGVFRKTYRTMNSKTGFQFYGVSFAGDGEIDYAFNRQFVLDSFQRKLAEMDRYNGTSCDLFKAINYMKNRVNFRPRLKRAAIIVTNTAIDKWQDVLRSLSNFRRTYKVVIPIGISNSIPHGNLKRLATKEHFSPASFEELSGLSTEVTQSLCSQTAYKTCRAPHAPSTATVQYNSLNPGAKAYYKCKEGFLLRSSTNVTICSTSGKWVGVMPRCDKFCGPPPAIENGEVSYTETFVNKIAIYKCNEGYSTRDLKVARCMSSRRWSHKAPKCHFSKCKAPVAIKDGDVRFTDTSPGDKANYTCHEGYAIVGKETVTCLSDLDWDHIAPKCRAACPPLEEPENGRVVPLQRYVGQRVRFMCNHGYRPTSWTHTRCKSDKKWTLSTVTCQKLPTRSSGFGNRLSTFSIQRRPSNVNTSVTPSPTPANPSNQGYQGGEAVGVLLTAGANIRAKANIEGVPESKSGASIISPTAVILGLLVCGVMVVAIQKIRRIRSNSKQKAASGGGEVLAGAAPSGPAPPAEQTPATEAPPGGQSQDPEPPQTVLEVAPPETAQSEAAPPEPEVAGPKPDTDAP